MAKKIGFFLFLTLFLPALAAMAGETNTKSITVEPSAKNKKAVEMLKKVEQIGDGQTITGAKASTATSYTDSVDRFDNTNPSRQSNQLKMVNQLLGGSQQAPAAPAN